MVCIFCKSSAHDYRSCPITYRAAQKKPVFKQDYVGKAPTVFVGRFGYPRVRVGILGTEQYAGHDAPQEWVAKGSSIAEIAQLRSELVNAYGTTDVRGAESDAVAKEVSLAAKPVDVEVNLQKKPQFRITYSKYAAPHGPSVAVKKSKVTHNTKIDWRVDKAVSATDLKATHAIEDLARKGISPYYLQKAFSLGNFGVSFERRIVPTRWSITAVDDTLGKKNLERIRTYAHADCAAYFGGYLGNYYLLLFLDDAWQYELFEYHLSSKQLWTDHESFSGRKNYAKETAGGYYAARVGIIDRLEQMKRQSAVLAIRVITDEYTAPLGVWVVREAVKNALVNPPIRFADRQLLFEYAREYMKRKFSLDISQFLNKSKLVEHGVNQRKLTQF